MNIEPLETRIAPATLVGNVLTYTDLDGDHVRVTISKGTLAGTMFTFDTGSVNGDNSTPQVLRAIDLTAAANVDDANITTAVTKAATGDGLVNIGRITASAHDLGSVTIKGDLEGLFCGDGNAATGPGLKLLSARSMGIYGGATQGGGGIFAVVEGALGAVKVTGDVVGANIGARNFSEAADGKVGSVVIGGSLIGTTIAAGGLFSTGDMSSVKIGRDIRGGVGGSAGEISCGGTLVSLTIGGSLIGGESFLDGAISASEIGSIKIAGDIRGGGGPASGAIISSGKIASITVGGSLIGGIGDQTFTSNSDPVVGQIIAIGDLGSVKIAHDVIGREGVASASIQSLANIASITIGGSLIGGSGDESGKIDAGGKIARLSVGGDIAGGGGNQNTITDGGGVVHEGQVFALGEIGKIKVGRDVTGDQGSASGQVRSHARLASISIGGSLVGGSGAAGGQLAAAEMGAVKIGRSLVGGEAPGSGVIDSAGALTSVTIGGSLAGGSAFRTGEIFATGEIGNVKIGRDLAGGSIDGTLPSLDRSGYIQGGRIASLVIGGSIVAGIDSSTAGALTKNASIRAVMDIGSLQVKGDLVGNVSADGASLVVISAHGQGVPVGNTDLAIGKLTVGGRVERTNILGGFSVDLANDSALVQIGEVQVRRDWIASNLVAGIVNLGADDNPGGTGANADNVNFGDSHDRAIGLGSIFNRINSVVIGGIVAGSAAAGDHFGFSAITIGSFKALGFSAGLTPGASGDVIELSPITGDVSIRES